MINNRFLRIQLKRIWIPILVIGLIAGGFTFIVIGLDHLAPYVNSSSAGGSWSREHHNASFSLALYYRAILFSFLLVYAFICLIMLLLTEQDRGYVWSWLTSPMSRWTIFATKYLTMVIGLLIIQVWILLLQLILYGATMQDFKANAGNIFLSNFDVLVGVFFLASLMWLIGACFNRQWIPLLIISVVLVWCGITTTLGEMGKSNNVGWMKTMYYFSLFSLIHTPFEHFMEPDFSGGDVNGVVLGEILPIRAGDYCWQIPVMAILGVGSFIGSQYILKNKNYNV